MAGCQSLIALKTVYVKGHVNNILEEHRLPQRLQQELLDTIYQLPLEKRMVKAAVVSSPTSTRSQTSLDEECKLGRKNHLVHHNRRFQDPFSTSTTSTAGNTHGNQNSRSLKPPVLEECGFGLLESEAADNQK